MRTEKFNLCKSTKKLLTLITLLTLGVGQMWGAAKQRYIYVGISNTLNNNIVAGQWGFNVWGGTDGGVKSCTYIADMNHDGRDYKVFRAYVYDDNNMAQFKPKDGWWEPGSGKSVTLNGTNNNAVFFSHADDGWSGQFQIDYQVTSTASLAASSTSVAIGTNVTLTPSLSSNATYNEIKSTSYDVTTNPNSGGTVTSAGVFSATKAGSYTVTATVTYNAKDFSGITKTATATKTITVYATVTFDREGGSGGTGSQNATYNSATSNISAPSKDYHDFAGYWTGDDGTGTMVINASGVWQKNISNFTDNSSTAKWIILTNQTLHAKWTPKNYDISYLDKGGSSYSGSNGASLPNSYTYGTGVALTDGVRSGYRFDGWFDNSACTGDPVTSVSASDNGDKTFYALWTENPGGTVTLTAGTGGQVSKDNSSWGISKSYTGIKTTDALNIYAQASAGYTFSSWSRTSGTGTIASTTSASTTYTPVANADAELTANFTENTVTLTPSVSYDHGSSNYTASASNSGTVGVATTTNLSCSNPNAAHYTFAGWTLTNLTVTSGNAATDRSITVKITTPGSPIAAVANYNENLNTTWYICGASGGTSPFSGWGTGGTRMYKKSGYSTVEKYYCTISVASVADASGFGFKAYKSDESDDAHRYFAYSDQNYTIDNNSQTIYNNNGANDMHFKAYVTGDYEFEIDKTGANPVLTIHWPIYNQVRISAASPTDATNTGNFDLSDPVSNVRSVKRSLNANTTYTFKIVYNSDFYGYNSGTFTRSTSTSSNSRTISTSGGDMTLTTDYAGDYTFKFNESTKALSVDFPAAYKITFGKGSVDGTTGSFSAVDLDNGSSAVTSNSTWVKSGDDVKITAPDAKSGYRFLGWYDNNSATGDAITTNANCTISVTSATTVYACYAENLSSITVSAGVGGTVSKGSGTHSLGVTTGVAIDATPSTGYSWSTWTTSGNAALGTTASTKINTAKGNGTNGGSGTITATFTPNHYDVILDVNGGSGDNQTVDATFAAAMPTVQKGGSTPIATRSRTGYNFDGYWATNTGTGTQYYTSALASNHNWDVATNETHIYAKWNAKQSAITFDYQTGVTGYGSSGAITNATGLKGTYDAEMTALTGTMPSAIDGYAFTGFYDATSGGTKYYNADGTSAHVWDKDTEEGTTLYARWEIAQITDIAFSPGTTVSPNATVTLTPTVSPAPTGATVICWKLLRNNGNLLSEEFTSNPSTPGNNVTFTAPETSSSYKVAAVLRTGSGCGTGTVLDSVVYDLVVAGSHTVTIRYQDSDGRTLAASTETEGRPLAWSSEINPATITGYTFDHWVAGDGVTITTDDGETTVTETSTETIKIQATYDGPLTAVYNKKKMIYFNNTLNWDTVYVYFYKDGNYWGGDNQGTGTNPSYHGASYSGVHGGMTKIAGTNVYYFDAEAASADSYTNVAFTEKAQDNCYYFYDGNKVVGRGDYDATRLPMFVPISQTPESKNGGAASYYNKGYWMNYPENTGYWLKIYNQTATAGATKLYDLPFTFPEGHAMPLELAVDLEAGQTYGFEIARADGLNYRNPNTMTATTTNWKMDNQTKYCGLQTTAAGEYTFSLAYFEVGSDYAYRVGVTYPVAVNDYRIVYTDDATWSKGAHGASWYHPSGVITKNSSATEVKNDTVSFFWSYGSSPAISYQTCSAVAAGSASWSAGTSISVSDFLSVLKEKGVYNFIFQQPAGGASISLVKVEPYSGNYYIRTDCAGSTKWVNYRALDHQMTYSDYAEANSGYSHYFCHWVTTGTNVKFVIANDYSACISDTLSEDYGTTIADITAEGNDGAGTLNSGNASIRFMWNQKTNVINRAYISGSSNVSDRFLILEGDAKLYDENGNSYSISGLDANEVNLIDDQNFVYERTIKVNATARAKLTAKYNENVQYFKGSEGAFAEGTTVQLLGGTYDAEKKYSMRLVYDFKTDRLVTAYIPEGTVDAQLNIQADLMIIREHQEAGQQLLFSGSGALNEVQSVYGVMRFNRWTLNNRQHPEDHDKAHCWNDALITTYHPLLGPGNVKSSYERALYWISFPFDVNLSDVFGFGTYGTHWIIMKYNGAKRATDGYWKDSEGFWEYIWDRNGVTLEKGKGYVLALELELMQATDSVNFWTHQIQEVELFFPSASTEVGTITQTSVDVTVPPHECTIDRRTKDEKDAGTNNWNKDRTIADSHWNIIGVPSYANYGSTLSDGSSTITWNSNPKTQSLPFLYEWNASDNTYTVQSGTTYNFKAMHAYYVQYTGNLHWTLASATPPSIVARRTYAEAPESIEMKIELQQNETMIDQTFVKLSNDDNVSAGFAFGEDLNKEKNAGKANIYTFIDNYMPTAGNTMPMIDQTTFIPMGVSIPTAGEYTFSIPDGTDGVGVFLIDNVANTRTNLSALDYTVNLTTGTHDGRFILEISPIHNATTDIEAINDEGIKISGARKVLIDGILYIVKGDKLYDVRGTMIK